MYFFILKHRLRTTKGILKHFWTSFIGLIAVSGYFLAQFYSKVLNGGIGFELSEKNIFYFLIFCIALNGFRILLKKQPIITLNAATVHYLYFTEYFKQILIFEYVWMFIKTLFVTFVISGIISGFELNQVFLRYFLLILGYMFVGVLLAWSRYHVLKGKLKLVIILCYIVTSIVFVAEIGIISLVLNYSLLLFWICYVIFKLELNLAKYIKDTAFIDETNSASSQFNLAKMSQMAIENVAKKKHKFFLYHFPLKKDNAVFYKSILELIRTGNSVWGLILFLFLMGFLFYRTPVFSIIPIFGGISALATTGALSLIMMTYINIGEILKKHAITLVKKHKQGLFIPLGRQKIIFSYLIVSILIFAILAFFTGLIFESKFFVVLLFYIMFIVIFALDFYITLIESRISKVSNKVMPIILFMLGFIFFI